MTPWHEHEGRVAVWFERIEQFGRETEVRRLLEDANIQHPLKTLFHQLWNWLNPRATLTKKPTWWSDGKMYGLLQKMRRQARTKRSNPDQRAGKFASRVIWIASLFARKDDFFAIGA